MKQTWGDLPLRAKGLVVVAIPLVALLIATPSIFAIQRVDDDADAWVRHTLQVRGDLQNVMALLLDAQSAVRGYTLTGQPDYLRPYKTAVAELPRALDQVANLVQDNPGQHERVGRIARLAQQELGGLATLQSAAAPDARAAAETANTTTMTALRQELNAAQDEEDRLLAEREARKERARATTYVVDAVALLGGLFGGIAATWLFTRSIAGRVEQLQENADRLARGISVRRPPGGGDEVGRLGRSLAEAAELLEQRERELRDARSFLEHLIESGPVAMFRGVANGALTLTYVSPNVQRLTGFTAEEVARTPGFWTQRIHPDDRRAIESELAGASPVAQRQRAHEFRFQHRDGSYRWLTGVMHVEAAAGEGPTAFLGYVWDVTERKQAEEAAMSAQREAERASRTKSEFLSRMSHELRTPLNSILGFAQLLEMDALSADQRESVEYILKAGRHLLELINEVLDIARIEAGRLPLSPEPVHVGDLLRESIEMVQPLASHRGIRIDAEAAIASAADRHVMADRQRLKQVFLNLLSNAIKYNRAEGSVSVAYEATPGDHLRVSIQDTGHGIAPEAMADLFTPFSRLGADAAGVEGTGLGLALSKRLVEAMGGTISAQSDIGRGSTFWIELRLVQAPLDELGEMEAALAALPAGSGRRCTVLYVEDNLANLKLIERLLARRPEVSLLSVMQGLVSIDMAREHQPDLILLDLHLPDLPGTEVLRRLREDPATRHIPVIVISADATTRQIQRLLAAGASAYLTKPIDVAKFFEAVDTALRGIGVA